MFYQGTLQLFLLHKIVSTYYRLMILLLQDIFYPPGKIAISQFEIM